MNRLATGAALGGIAVYLFDPDLGLKRRERLTSLYRENRATAMQAGRAASQAVESARPLAQRMTDAVGRTDWAEAFDRRKPKPSLIKWIGAAAMGGALVYFFLDPAKGSERRQKLLDFWQEKSQSTLEAGREAARQTAEAVKPVAGRVGDQVAGAVEGVRTKVAATVNGGTVPK
jgi:gas vesicle protein